MNQVDIDADGDDIAYETVVDSHGRVTIYNGATAVAHISNTGALKQVLTTAPKWSRVKVVHFVRGVTLDRVSVVAGLGTPRMQIVIKKIPDAQMQIQCDRCPKKHSKHTELCSANLGLRTFATAADHLYNIETGEDTGRWRFQIMFLASTTVGEGSCDKA